MRLLFADGHMHSNPVKGLGIRSIAKRFKQYGGWFIAIVSLSPQHYGFELTLDGYRKSVEIVISECRAAYEEGLKVACFAGVHPADIDQLISQDPKKSNKVIALAINIVNHIAEMIKEGLLNGIGEIGRPHYKALPESFIANSIVMRYAMNVARDLQCLVHLHLEQGGYITIYDVNEIITLAKLSKDNVIIHHSDILTAHYAQEFGFMFTIPGKLPVLAEAFKRFEPSYTIESDFIDDPKRPGVSSYPWQIIENQRKLLDEGLISEEYLYKLNVDNIAKAYNVTPP
ncbi:MAG: TatD family hydrolase [archaeon YNP-WB-062]|jgi:TatD-related deoxyribonuclease|nr:TatD family hydrolase [Candidatus Culexarchaeum yellowstonense]